MIRALPGCLRSLDARRVLGVLALLAVVVVLFAGAAHAAADPAHAGDHGCCVCFATLSTAGATIPAPTIVVRAEDAPRDHAPIPSVSDVARTSARLPASRAPPVGA